MMDQVLLKKIISLCMYPVGIVALFFLLGIVLRWRGRIYSGGLCFVLSVAIFLLATNIYVGRTLTQSLENRFPQRSLEEIPRADAIVVLGGGLRVPHPPLQHAQLKRGSDRYWYATRLYRAKKASTIIVAGGRVFGPETLRGEAYYIAEILQEWGVPEQAIVLEQASRTTGQNAGNTAAIIAELNLSSILLVTSAIHMPRAYLHFSQLPVKVIPASADVLINHSKRPELLNWLPSVDGLMLTTWALHEYYGMWASQFSEVKSWLAGYYQDVVGLLD